MIELKYHEDLYPKSVLIKAAYRFIDRAYIHLDKKEDTYIVCIQDKEGEQSVTTGEFDNEMLAQCARYSIMKQTKSIRDIMIARALASTIIEEQPEAKEDISDDNYDVDQILKDWFSE